MESSLHLHVLISLHFEIIHYYNSNLISRAAEVQSPWYMVSLVYKTFVRVSVRTALRFGKQTVPFQFYNLKFDSYTIICGVKLLSVGINYFLLSFPIDLEHSWNRLEYRNSISVLNNQKPRSLFLDGDCITFTSCLWYELMHSTL